MFVMYFWEIFWPFLSKEDYFLVGGNPRKSIQDSLERGGATMASEGPLKCALNLRSCLASCLSSFGTICKGVEGTRAAGDKFHHPQHWQWPRGSRAGIPETGRPDSEAWLCQIAGLQFQIHYSSSLAPIVLCKVGFLTVPTSSGCFEKWDHTCKELA